MMPCETPTIAWMEIFHNKNMNFENQLGLMQMKMGNQHHMQEARHESLHSGELYSDSRTLDKRSVEKDE